MRRVYRLNLKNEGYGESTKQAVARQKVARHPHYVTMPHLAAGRLRFRSHTDQRDSLGGAGSSLLLSSLGSGVSESALRASFFDFSRRARLASAFIFFAISR